jgi:N-methylhydantoinase A
MPYKLGIDIGDNFTDLVLLDDATGQLTFCKTPTTSHNPTDGIVSGMTELLKRAALQPADLAVIVQGTTLVSNAVNRRKGALIGLITTEGFEDVLETGREPRYDSNDVLIAMPEPLVPRNLRLGISELIDYQGNELSPLVEDDVAAVVEVLAHKGVKAIAICLLHAVTNPDHERAIGQYIQENYPDIPVSLSADVLSDIREYERMSATVMNAYVQPLVDQYLDTFRARLDELGFDGICQIMTASGQLTAFDVARQLPIHLLESGPAGGALAGSYFGKLTEHKALITFDMGGSTASASAVMNHVPGIMSEFEAGRMKRFQKGSGLPVRLPILDVVAVGAGGGSIAWLDRLGLLHVGPDSATPNVGPACYGRGGTRPTLTDADLVLGYLNPRYFLGGTLSLDRGAARLAIATHIADPLDISIEEAAMGICRVANENMANAIRAHLLEKDLDPQQVSLVAFGGSGPVHAFELARLLGSPDLIIPVGAGVASVFGLLHAPTASENTRSYVSPVADLNWDYLNDLLHEMEQEGRAFLAQAGLLPADGVVSRVARLRYSGQGHEVSIALPPGELTAGDIPDIEQRFADEYRQRFGRLIDKTPIEAVTWRMVVSSEPALFHPKRTTDNGRYEIGGKDFNALKGYRPVYLMGDLIPCSCPVYDRYQIRPNDTLSGPVIIEEAETTIVIGNRAYVRMDEHRNLIINIRR